MQAPITRRKKRGKLYFSSNKALKMSRMGKKKMANDRFETSGINKVLDFEEREENATLSTVDESQGQSTPREGGSQSRGGSREMGTQSNPEFTPAMEEQSPELEVASLMEELEETSLVEPEGAFLKP
jgi:hypothetical protein